MFIKLNSQKERSVHPRFRLCLDYPRLFNVCFIFVGAPENLSAPTTHITLVDDDVELDEDDGDMEVSFDLIK